jgi:hypothetical protein
MELQQVATGTTTIMTMAVTAPSTSPVPVPVGGPQVAVAEIPDDDVPPPGWDQWVSQPFSAPEPPTGVLVMREDGCVVSGCPVHGAEASSSRTALPALGGPVAHPEQERERVDVPPAHFASAQAEQALWQEFCDHVASLNRALNEVLWIHGGLAWRIFQVSDFPPGFVVFSLCFFRAFAFPDPRLLSPCLSAGFGVPCSGAVRHPRPPG